MKKTAHNLLRLLRPRQWVKNLAVFAAITFNGQLFNLAVAEAVLAGFIVFCATSSAIYVINDIIDVKKDRLHPFKRFRPIANGDVTVPVAILIALILLTTSLTATRRYDIRLKIHQRRLSKYTPRQGQGYR